MSRFAVLRDDDDDDDTSEPYEPDAFPHLSPRYTREEILAVHQSACDAPPPAGLPRFANVFAPDFQPPECGSFRPPTSDINSQAYRGGRGPSKPPTRGPDERPPSEPERDLGGLWFYKDPMDRVIGPFPSARMREWLDRRVIDATLLVRPAASDGKFQRIFVLFPDLAAAFSDQGVGQSGGDQTERLLTLVSFSMSDDENAWDVDAS
jgi:hypothetical protein